MESQSNIVWQKEERNTLWYNSYTHRATVHIPGIRFAYYGKNWQEVHQRMISNDYIPGRDKNEFFENIENIQKFWEWRTQSNITSSVRFNKCDKNTLSLFTSEPQLVENLPFSSQSTYSYVVVPVQSNVKYFAKPPKHNYRIYLKSKRLTHEVSEKFIEWLTVHSDKFYPSAAFKYRHIVRSTWRGWRIAHRNTYISSQWYIEYDDEMLHSWLLLCWGELLGRNYKLEKRVEAT